MGKTLLEISPQDQQINGSTTRRAVLNPRSQENSRTGSPVPEPSTKIEAKPDHVVKILESVMEYTDVPSGHFVYRANCGKNRENTE